MTHFRLRWFKHGAHIHVRLFAASSENTTYGKLGQLYFTETEWEAFLQCFNDHGVNKVVVVPDDGDE